MSVIKYSLAKDGEKQLSKNLQVKEMASKDGADAVYVDTELVKVFQFLRDKIGKPGHISSGYRSLAHNRAVGGVVGSYHTKGKAMDIWFDDTEPTEVAKIAETYGLKGIGCYPYKKRMCHLDTRTTKYFWRETKTGSTSTVSTHGGAPPKDADDMFAAISFIMENKDTKSQVRVEGVSDSERNKWLMYVTDLQLLKELGIKIEWDNIRKLIIFSVDLPVDDSAKKTIAEFKTANTNLMAANAKLRAEINQRDADLADIKIISNKY